MRQFKPLLPLGSETVIDHVISTFLNCGVEVLLVAGHRLEELRAVIKKRAITIVENPDYRQGMFSSIQAGIRCLEPIHRAFFIMPVDIPLVREATIRRLLNAAEEQPKRIIYPVFGEKRGHPPLIPSGFVIPVLFWQGGGGLKAFLNSQEEMALEAHVADSNVLFDIDTPEDYELLLERYHRGEVPTDEECEVILTTICKVTPERIRHCLKVAQVATVMAWRLIESGHDIDFNAIRAAATLHDIAKGQRQHDITEGKILREMGFNKVGEIVATHSTLSEGNTGLSLEAKVVYLADKLVEGETLVTIETRYANVNRRHVLTPDIEAGSRSVSCAP
jgi:molybdenum cofactor cytidylyltransferase